MNPPAGPTGVFITITFSTPSVVPPIAVTVLVDFGDGTPATPQPLNFNPATATATLRHRYSTPGVYNIIATLSTTSEPEGVDQAIRCTIQDPVGVPSLLANTPQYSGNAIRFSLDLGVRGSDTCVRFEFGDGSQTLMGDASCRTGPDDVQPMRLPTQDPVMRIWTYSTPGVYQATVTVWNAVSQETAGLSVVVVSRNAECLIPETDIISVSSDPQNPTTFPVFESRTLQAAVATDCDPPRPTVISWTVRPYTGGTADVITRTNTYAVTIEPHTIPIGTYRIQLAVNPEGMDELRVTQTGYIRLSPSPLLSVISGGQERSVSRYNAILLDGTGSHDPDSIASGLSVSWSCRLEDGRIVDPENDVAWATGSPCLSGDSSNGIPGSDLTTVLDPDTLLPATAYIVRLKVTTGDGRSAVSTQTLVPLDTREDNIGIR